jgi:Tfp pilus assembly pilus retraction ATPase PilT
MPINGLDFSRMASPTSPAAPAPQASSAPAIGATTDPLKLLSEILQLAVRHKASDVHLRTRAHPIMRVDGVLRAIRDVAPLPAEFMERLSRTVMSARLISEFDRNHQVDLSIGFKDIGRVRVNVFMHRGSIGMVLRVINTQIPGFDDLGLPEMFRKFSQLVRGQVDIGPGSFGSFTCGRGGR